MSALCHKQTYAVQQRATPVLMRVEEKPEGWSCSEAQVCTPEAPMHACRLSADFYPDAVFLEILPVALLLHPAILTLRLLGRRGWGR
jgi:hypothetical protein